MIQRIQSLYLFVAAAVMGVASCVKLAYFSAPMAFYDLHSLGLYSPQGELIESTKYMTALFGISAILPLVNIFLFKKRTLQSKVCKMAMVLTLSSVVMMTAYVYLIAEALGLEASWFASFQPLAVTALLPLLFLYLAMAAINRDEALVRSLDRIR